MYFKLSYTSLSPLSLEEKINNASGASAVSKKVCDVSKGGGGLQKNVHMTFLVDKIDMWRFPKIAKSVQSEELKLNNDKS